MIKEYILNNYSNGDPIFVEDLPCKSVQYLRQELKKLTDKKELCRFSNGIYFLPYKTILGTDGSIPFYKFINSKYIKDDTIGFYTGLALLNRYGFTTQLPSIIEIKSNKGTTTQRNMEFNGIKYILYNSKVIITKDNIKELELLDLLTIIHKYSELSKEKSIILLQKIIEENRIDFNIIKENLQYYPDVVYKNIYEWGLVGKLL